MILQYDDIVMQVVTRLKAAIPQGSPGPPPTPKVANIIAFENPQEFIDKFFKDSAEQAQILVTYSGNTTEGYRHISNWEQALGKTTQILAHTIEVHICTRRYMDVALGAGKQNTSLRLMMAVRAALLGMYMQQRDGNGNILPDQMSRASGGGMILIESLIDQNVPGVVTVCRFQVLERISAVGMFDVSNIWGQYREITFEEYSGVNGQGDIDISGPPTDEVTVP